MCGAAMPPAVALVAILGLRLFGAHRQEDDDLFHPGYEAAHVTRLHRYEHEGIASFLEEEARWHAEPLEPELSSSFLARARSRLVGAEVEQTAEQDFVRVSRKQAAALRAHHEASWLQVSEVEYVQTNASSFGRLRSAGEIFRYHGKVLDDDHFAVTQLTDLSSQYIGQIGVGSVLSPEGCAPSVTESLMYIGDGDLKQASKDQLESCHVQDEVRAWVVFDTGSTNIWINSDLCKSGPCSRAERSRYDHTLSRTFVEPHNKASLEIQFGTGTIAGTQAIDDFHIGPFTVYNQTFGMIESQEGRVFEEVPFEGILGLAFRAMAASGVRPFVDGIIDNKAMAHNEFAFYFSPNSRAGNAIFWGGVDKNFYSGDIEYYNVIEPYYWALELRGIKIGDEQLIHLLLDEDEAGADGEQGQTGQSSGTVYKVIIDTGTTFFTAQDRLWQEVERRLKAAPCDSITKESHPDITYTLVNSAGQERDFVITNKQYMLGSDEGENRECSAAFMKINVPKQHGPGVVFGEVFLRIFFSVFDRGATGDSSEARIGFAPAVHTAKSRNRLKEVAPNQPSFHQNTQG